MREIRFSVVLRELGNRLGELLDALDGEVPDGLRHELRLGREVVHLRTARDPRPLDHARGGEVGVAVLDETVDGRVEQRGAGGGAPLLLRAARRFAARGARHRPHPSPGSGLTHGGNYIQSVRSVYVLACRAMSVSTSEFNTETIGSWSDPDEFVVERDRIKAYAAATNDPFEVHQSGDIAPPVFAVVPAFGALAATSTSVIPPDALMMVLHGEQDFHFHQPIRPDTTLVTRAVALGVQPRSSGVTVNVKGETRDKDSDELIVEQYMISFVRGPAGRRGRRRGAAPPRASTRRCARSDPDAEIAQTYDEDQTFRYAEAAGDPMPIHLDDEIAKAMGFPGIIIHGLCTMAFTSVANIQHACPDDPTRLKRLAVRFSKIALPKQTITTRIWDAGERDGRDAFAFETTSDSDDIVIKDGLAEVAR